MKFMSHSRRLKTSFDSYEVSTPRPTVRNVRVQKVDEVNRRVTTKIEKRTINRSEEMKPYCVSDFSLDNLIAVGVKMTPTSMASSPHKAVSDMAATLDSIDIEPNNDK